MSLSLNCKTRPMIQFGNGIRSDKTMLYAVLGLAVLANASGLFVTILEPDSASYASIAKTMVERRDFVNLFAMGEDWLDKPHLPFWLSAISFSVFGFSTWAYKLPALLLVLLSAHYTYLFARLFYDKHVALVATIIFFLGSQFFCRLSILLFLAAMFEPKRI